MNEPAANLTPTTTEIGVKPKVLRRPAQFSGGPAISNVVPMPIVKLEKLPMIVPELPPTLTWQEDSRFGLVLIALLILVNIAAAIGLSTPTQKEPTPIIIQSATRDTAPTADENSTDAETTPFVHVLDEAPAPDEHR